MPQNRFDWSALPNGLLRQLREDLGLSARGVPQALAKRFGAQPTERFVQEVWPALRDRWVAKDPVVRRSIVTTLRERGLGTAGLRGSSARTEVSYLRSCRNSESLRRIVLAHLLVLGQHVRPLRTKPAPHAARGQAWDEFATVLARTLAQLEVDQFLVLTTRRKPTHYVQFSQQGPHGLRVETASNAFLEQWERLDDAAQARLEQLGWLAPAETRSSPPSEQGSTNYYRDWPLPVPYPEVASFAVHTLDEVLEVHHPGFLMYKAFAHGGMPIILPNLGLVREKDEPPTAPTSTGLQQDVPSGPDELLVQVKEVVRSLLEVDDVVVDDDGDILIRSEASLTYVRVFKDAPVVRVFSPVLWDMGSPADIKDTVNDINRTTNWVKAIWDNGTVVLVSDVTGAPLAKPQLTAAINSVVARADEYGPELQQRYGGRMAFGSPLPPRQELLGGYL